MKKYLIRLIAVLPMLAVAISMVVFIVLAFDCWWWILLFIGNFWAFTRLAKDYEWYVRELASIIRDMAVDALHE